MKIICIGRNYADHAKELNNPVPKQPLVFMKPASSILRNGKPFFYPEFTSDLHYECEVVLKISKNGKHIAKEFAYTYYEEIGLGIDWTARDLQQQCKEKGHPWEIAKGFDGSAFVGDFVSKHDLPNPITFRMDRNGETVQQGTTADLLFDFDTIITHVSKYFRLLMGDLIFTGTPAGVGPTSIGDTLVGYFDDNEIVRCRVK